jgi:hypothetical protein
MIRPRRRLRRFAKYTGVVLCAVILVAWFASRWWAVGLTNVAGNKLYVGTFQQGRFIYGRQAWGFSHAGVTQPQTREVQVTVKVQDNQAAGLVGVPVAVGPSTGMLGKTDENGNVALTGSVDSALTSLLVALVPMSNARTAVQSEAEAVRFNEVVRKWSFPLYARIQLAPEVNEYQVTITGQPASVISGRVVDAQASGVKGVVSTRDGLDLVETSDEGAFSIGGIDKQLGVELFALDPATGRVVSRVITQAQALVGGDIEDIVVPASAGSEVNMTVVGREALPLKFTNRRDSVSLIGTNGMLFTFPVRKGGEVRLTRRGPELPRVPDGTYYVAPGHIGANRTVNALLDAVRGNRIAELEHAGVQKLVVAGGTPLVTLNVAAQEEAIFTLGGEQ